MKSSLRPWSPALFLYRQARRGVLVELRALRKQQKTSLIPSLMRIVIKGEQKRAARLRQFLREAEAQVKDLEAALAEKIETEWAASLTPAERRVA